MRVEKIIFSVFFLVLGGCATGYHALNFNGGYSEIMMNPDAFCVTYHGNQHTSSVDATRYVLLRASELTLQQGYRYFSIVSWTDQTSSSPYSRTCVDTKVSENTHKDWRDGSIAVKESTSSSTYLGTIVKPGAMITVKCFHDKPLREGSSVETECVDAQFYWENNKK